MDKKLWTHVWRPPLISTAIIVLVWAIWEIFGTVPTVSMIKLTPLPVSWQLPFGISRWWDVLIVSVLSTILTIIGRKVDHDFVACLFVGFLFVGPLAGIVIGLCYGMMFWLLIPGLIIDLIFGLGFGFFIARGSDLTPRLGFGLGYGLGIGLVYGLIILGSVYGLIFGLVFGLVIDLIYGLIFGLRAALKELFSQPSSQLTT